MAGLFWLKHPSVGNKQRRLCLMSCACLRSASRKNPRDASLHILRDVSIGRWCIQSRFEQFLPQAVVARCRVAVLAPARVVQAVARRLARPFRYGLVEVESDMFNMAGASACVKPHFATPFVLEGAPQCLEYAGPSAQRGRPDLCFVCYWCLCSLGCHFECLVVSAAFANYFASQGGLPPCGQRKCRLPPHAPSGRVAGLRKHNLGLSGPSEATIFPTRLMTWATFRSFEDTKRGWQGDGAVTCRQGGIQVTKESNAINVTELPT